MGDQAQLWLKPSTARDMPCACRVAALSQTQMQEGLYSILPAKVVVVIVPVGPRTAWQAQF